MDFFSASHIALHESAVGQTASDLSRDLESRYDVVVSLREPGRGDEYQPHISILDAIKATRRGEGTGSEVMQEIVRWADANGYILALTPTSDFGGSVPRLKRFYARFGFVPNRGRNKDFRTWETMIRYPKGYKP